jgi:FtsP/CotA-like multicopper oxidase with cupredoxin domain
MLNDRVIAGGIDYTKTGVKGVTDYATFGCNVFRTSPPTPDKLTPDVKIFRSMSIQGTMTTPDGSKLNYWSFVDPASTVKNPYPSPTIRVREGQIVHNTLTTEKNAHTIHHHGIEPTTMNDGVGHVSFEIKDQYTYQWVPRSAGTYFYHCHRNTVLHFEMGLLGLLIVDPPEGPGYLYSSSVPNAPYQRYDVERAWVVDDMDPRWHNVIGKNHDAGMCGEDVGLNRFEPKYFFVTGVFNNKTMTDQRVAATAKLGETILVRLLNASYSILRVTFDVDVVCVGCDGHRLAKDAWNSCKLLPKGIPFELTTAGRLDLLIKPTQPGTYGATIEFLHWITRQVQDNGKGVAKTQIVVS